MFNELIRKILAGSRAYCIGVEIVRNSAVCRTAVITSGLLVQIFTGSRLVQFIRHQVVPVFLVGDYMNQQYDFKPLLLDSSKSWKRISALVSGNTWPVCKAQLRKIAGESITANALPVNTSSDMFMPDRLAMGMVVAFLLLYYPIRLVMILLIPSSIDYAGRISGVSLALLLSAIYLLLSRPTDSNAD